MFADENLRFQNAFLLKEIDQDGARLPRALRRQLSNGGSRTPLLVFISQFDPSNILGMISGLGAGIGIVLVLIGAVQAFLWKLAFYINLVLGIIVTAVLTYAASLLGVGLGSVALVFFIGIGLSLAAAFLGALLAIIEGFLWCTLGLGIYCLSGGMNLSSSAIAAGIGGVIIVAIAAFIGGSVDRWLVEAIPSVGRSRGNRTGTRRRDSSGGSGGDVSRVPRDREIYSIPSPAVLQSVQAEHYTPSVRDSCKVCNMDFVYYGVSDALKCPSCGNVFHHDCLSEFVKLNGTCPGCNRHMETI